jgi:hypothetical protein
MTNINNDIIYYFYFFIYTFEPFIQTFFSICIKFISFTMIYDLKNMSINIIYLTIIQIILIKLINI